MKTLNCKKKEAVKPFRASLRQKNNKQQTTTTTTTHEPVVCVLPRVFLKV
jgi:hypothetical protein